ncbi:MULTISPECIES: 1-deoxy-D-xylulose-5-phosphate reductoisomerase [Deefgea]|uniref:1-deoxy-D-xylulose 5-phosphate reductoisomerase n=1 Tax=Deefgea chitinilytica TaxID=570276 RepID=A0ABS2C8N4_9NEIS|nr:MULTISPECIES: 1-deoxy-D-xylulose-5-phosphate reductoisomerase [Deefgea]MBM5570511.1 1-deoxy-D-xylulose-5-phosphate reductoisomerase [Deefgea chitinilytica]MBM9887740.1 1-deoxy-D-xylulose-5-phosphate reductoisomerase [Deefgea sp. CFH1-16]
MQQQIVTVLGATGSIGTNTLDVIERHPERYQVYALSAATQIEKLIAACEKHRPKHAVVLDEVSAEQLSRGLRLRGLETQVSFGSQALIEISTAPEVTTVMAAIVGAAGMSATLAAAKASKRVLLANKETLVLAGQLFMDAASHSASVLLPIDSEHNAIFQALPAAYRENPYQSSLAEVGIERILLTASGGPFRTRELATFADITVAEAVKHPNWSMGRKISVDSASMMNKGLEVIEARWLFNALADQIQVVVHPQSVIHSMVQYRDGSVLAQLGSPDMRTPIAYGLAYPERIDAGVQPLDLFAVGRLDFSPPDTTRFPCLGLAFSALKQGGAAPAVLNAANEIAVEAFLNERIKFIEIPQVIDAALSQLATLPSMSIEQLLEADAQSRVFATQFIQSKLSSC